MIDKAIVYKELNDSSTTNFIDLYKCHCFVLKAKQGSNPKPIVSLPVVRN